MTSNANRLSGRIKDANKQRVLDKATRQRRARKALEALESDNFHDDPHADLVMNKKAPKFQETLDAKSGGTKKKKSKSAEYYKLKFRKSLAQMIEEEKVINSEGSSYENAEAQPSKFPSRHFCAVCGFPSNYTCVSCGSRYCCIRCLGTHQDTRCLKWTA